MCGRRCCCESGLNCGGQRVLGVEAEEELVGVAGEDEDGAFVLGEDVLAVAAEAKVLQ